jgi:exodeoxyribonuclease V alpha subunit
MAFKKTQNINQSPLVIKAVIKNIVFANDSTGFAVIRFFEGEKGPLTAAGQLGSIFPGETLLLKGYWSSHKKFGEQFKVIEAAQALPDTVDGIKAYLGSGMIKGIGKEYASKIVDHFGSDTLDILDKNPEKLRAVPGIGKKRQIMITRAWSEHKTLRDVMIFLQSYGISTAFAHRIYKKYGDTSIFDVTSNPYRLCEDIHGIGFKSADRIAMKMNIEPDSAQRCQAAVLYCLNSAQEQGHCYFPLNNLKDSLEALIGDTCTRASDYEFINDSLQSLESRGRIVRAGKTDDPFLCWVFLEKIYRAEEELAIGIYRLAKSSIKISGDLIMGALDSLSGLSNGQMKAVKRVFSSGVSVITGGPGTGKTTTLKSLIKVFEKLKLTFVLASPTGRAAKRLSEATGRHASTVHRLLEFSPMGDFQKNRDNPLKYDAVIIDEASMLDLFLADSLVKALKAGTLFVLVGDINQLPSVGPGSVLKDIIASEIGTTSILDEIFRQAGESMIVVNAHRINKGLFPKFRKDDIQNKKRDFYFIPEDDSEKLPQVIAGLVKKRLPSWGKFHPVRDIQVLCPMHKGSAGVLNLNAVLKQALNKNKGGLERGPITFDKGDKIMVTKNNYTKELFNGDLGTVIAVDTQNDRLTADFDGKIKVFERADLHQIELAYAISIHKSQGSEYPAVVIPVHTQHFIMLYRNLIYTAVTRAKKLAVLVGNTRGLSIAVKKNDTLVRYTMLESRIKNIKAHTQKH